MSADRDAPFLAAALEEAKLAAEADEVPVGAVIVHAGQIIARGRNRREELQRPTSHAEIHAIEEAAVALGSWRLIDCELYVTLEPCPMCLAACQQARVSRVVYGAKDPKGGALCLGYELHSDARTNHRFSADYVETPECSRILTEFFRRKRSE